MPAAACQGQPRWTQTSELGVTRPRAAGMWTLARLIDSLLWRLRGQARVPAPDKSNSRILKRSSHCKLTARSAQVSCWRTVSDVCLQRRVTCSYKDAPINYRGSSWENVERCQNSRYQKDGRRERTNYLHYVIHLERRWLSAEIGINQLYSEAFKERHSYEGDKLALLQLHSQYFHSETCCDHNKRHCWWWVLFVFYQKTIFLLTVTLKDIQSYCLKREFYRIQE